jgi:hypothetical protein
VALRLSASSLEAYPYLVLGIFQKGDLKITMDERTRKAIFDAKICISENGGVIRNPTKQIVRPIKPGLKVLAALDCLVNYGGYTIVKPMGNRAELIKKISRT